MLTNPPAQHRSPPTSNGHRIGRRRRRRRRRLPRPLALSLLTGPSTPALASLHVPRCHWTGLHISASVVLSIQRSACFTCACATLLFESLLISQVVPRESTGLVPTGRTQASAHDAPYCPIGRDACGGWFDRPWCSAAAAAQPARKGCLRRSAFAATGCDAEEACCFQPSRWQCLQ